MPNLKCIVESYMQNVSGIRKYCDRCLKTKRWDGNIVLMIVDAAFTSIGLNYFTSVIPKVEEFKKKFVGKKVKNLKTFVKIENNELRKIWKNKRSWFIAKQIASYLSIFEEDTFALKQWAKKADLENWRKDPIGRIKGVGVVTFQYLRMMGGIDTVMPDKIVKKVINEILVKAELKPVNEDIEFVKKVKEISLISGYRPIELCWMTWFVQPEGKKMRMEKYKKNLSQI
jgi:hypothetical protein